MRGLSVEGVFKGVRGRKMPGGESEGKEKEGD